MTNEQARAKYGEASFSGWNWAPQEDWVRTTKKIDPLGGWICEYLPSQGVWELRYHLEGRNRITICYYQEIPPDQILIEDMRNFRVWSQLTQA